MESARADVLIETIRCLDNAEMPWWSWHIQRLRRSAHALGFAPVPVGIEQTVTAAITAQAVAARNTSRLTSPKKQDTAQTLRRVRLLYHRDGEVEVVVTPLPAPPSPFQAVFAQNALGVTSVLDSHEPLLRHKATFRPWYITAADWLDQHPAVFDLIFFNERDELCEGARTNVYVLIDDQWITPSEDSGCLPGTVRARLLDEDRVRIGCITRDRLPEVRAWRMSNGLRGWFDVLVRDDGG